MDSNFAALCAQVQRAADAAGHPVRLLAVSKTRSAAQVRALAADGQYAFGENHVQEGMAKQAQLADLRLEWHMIGPLQSNKCREVARHFDWLQSLDREKLVAPLARHRPRGAMPLNVLIQVNIDHEASKSGCQPAQVAALARAIAVQPALRLRGLMAIPEPHCEASHRQAAFARMRELFDELRASFANVDTLSMGMSDDFELAIAAGATMVRIGAALFGPRAAP